MTHQQENTAATNAYNSLSKADKEKSNMNSVEQEMALANLNNRLHENFWVAYDALDHKNASTLLMRGISLAKET